MQPSKQQAKDAREFLRKNMTYGLLEDDDNELMPPPPSKPKSSLKRKLRTHSEYDYNDDTTTVKTSKQGRVRTWQENNEDPDLDEQRKKVGKCSCYP